MRYFSRCIIFIIVYIVFVNAPVFADVNKDEAVLSACRYLRGLSQTTPASQTSSLQGFSLQLQCSQADYLSQSRPGGLPAANWQSKWRLHFKNSSDDIADMDVIASTGSISRFYNYGLAGQLLKKREPPRAAISESEAIKSATAAIQATGQRDELIFDRAQLNQITSPPTDAGNLWTITWHRAYKGIPYRGQAANVLLLGSTGEVLALSLVYTTPPPAALTQKISKNQALVIARQKLAWLEKQGFTATKNSLQIVQPNSHWNPGDVRVSKSSLPHLAWTIIYSARTGNGATMYEVWIDTLSGDIIGGDTSSTQRALRKQVIR